VDWWGEVRKLGLPGPENTYNLCLILKKYVLKITLYV
jgi:hypothetical protein